MRIGRLSSIYSITFSSLPTPHRLHLFFLGRLLVALRENYLIVFAILGPFKREKRAPNWNLIELSTHTVSTFWWLFFFFYCLFVLIFLCSIPYTVVYHSQPFIFFSIERSHSFLSFQSIHPHQFVLSNLNHQSYVAITVFSCRKFIHSCLCHLIIRSKLDKVDFAKSSYKCFPCPPTPPTPRDLKAGKKKKRTMIFVLLTYISETNKKWL